MQEKVEIIKYDHFGRGIAKLNDKIVFVPNTLVGDIVEIEVQKNKKHYIEAKVVRYLNKMPREHLCPYAEFCGGCHLITIKYNEQIKWKQQKIKEIFKKELGQEIHIKETIIGQNEGYRNKVTFHVKDHQLGFYQEKSKNLIKIDKCIIAKPEINNLIPYLKKMISIGNITKIIVRSNRELLLDITGQIESEWLQRELNFVDTIIVNGQLIKGSGYITECFLDNSFKISSNSFFQVNKDISSRLFTKVKDYFVGRDNDQVLDLYCGVGMIALSVAPFVAHVTGIEVVKEAIDDANENKKTNQIANVDFICDKVENRIDEFKDIDDVIVDPPRSGLDDKTITIIQKINPKMIVYVSCDPSTLVRDIKKMNDYDLKEIMIADMFPNTYHVESVSLLLRK